MDCILYIGLSFAVVIALFLLIFINKRMKIDSFTQLKNESALEVELSYLSNTKKVCIVALEIFKFEQLKKENDKSVISQIVYETASYIKKNFADVGEPFRTAENEFVILCKNFDHAAIRGALAQTIQCVAELSENMNINIKLSYGYCFYDRDIDKSIKLCYEMAKVQKEKRKTMI